MLKELRCSNQECGKGKGQNKLLGKAYLAPGTVLEIKCGKCKVVTAFISAVPEEDGEIE